MSAVPLDIAHREHLQTMEEHRVWERELLEWRLTHRQVMDRLVKLQLALDDHGEALAKHAEGMRKHELHILSHESFLGQVARGAGIRNPATLEKEHEDLMGKHQQARARHESLKAVHETLMSEAWRLLHPDSPQGPERPAALEPAALMEVRKVVTRGSPIATASAATGQASI